MNRLIAVMLVFLAAGLLWGKSLNPEHEMLVRVQASRADIPELKSLGLYIYQVGPDYVQGAILPDAAQALAGHGFKYEVLISDMVAYAEEMMIPSGGFGVYHTYQQIMDSFHLVASANPNLCQLETIAQSATGRYVIALKITENPRQGNHRPRLVWDGTTHGNENIGTEVCWYFMQLLVGQYGIDPLITQLVNTREIWLIPVVNPDGLVNRTRGNSSVSDPNRDYGYAWNAESGANVPWYSPEIRGFRNFMQNRPFVVSMTYHSGTTSVMWPWSYSTVATHDSIAHKELCDRYSSFTGYPSFQISRGLYECQGTSSDFTHGAEGTLGLAAEIASGQPPPQGQIDTIAHANWSASRDLMIRGAYGVRGAITDSVTGAPVKRAFVVPSTPDWMTYADTCGWYFKYLRPGSYSLKVVAPGYATKTVSGITVPADTYVTVNIPLVRDTTAPVTGYKVTTWVCKSPSVAGSTMGFWTLGLRDNRSLALTARGSIVVELGNSVINGPGTDLTVYSTSTKPCSVFVSENEWNGPWRFCTYGSGNIPVDIASGGVSSARYVRLGDPGQSYDLDAIEGTVTNAPALTYHDRRIIDSTGNANGRLDPGEDVGLVLSLRNAGRLPANDVSGRLHCWLSQVTVLDSLGAFGTIPPDSVRSSDPDRFQVVADAGTPRGTPADFTLYLTGSDYADSIRFTIVVGQITAVDPIPDGPRTPPRYYAYDDIDSAYAPRPTYDWVEIKDLGTRLTLSDDQTVQISLPTGFGPWRYYGQDYTGISICSNGWVAAGATTSTVYQNTVLPSSTLPAPAICLCWDDLNPPTGQGVWYYHDVAGRRFIVEYDSISHYSPSGTYEKFELIIYDTSTVTPTGDNVLFAQYANAVDYSSVTVGLQDPTRTIGIQHLYNTTYHPAAAPIAAGRAIKYCTFEPITGLNQAGTSLVPGLSLAIGPNPVRQLGIIQFTLARPGPVRLGIYDAAGREVRALLNGNLAPGVHRALWDRRTNQGNWAAKGVYFIRLLTTDGLVSSKAVLLH